MIQFRVYGVPKGQPRPKAFARNFGGKWQARVYDPGTAESFKSAIAAAAQNCRPKVPLSGPISERSYGENTARQSDGSMKLRTRNIISDFGMRGNVWRGKTRGQEEM